MLLLRSCGYVDKNNDGCNTASTQWSIQINAPTVPSDMRAFDTIMCFVFVSKSNQNASKRVVGLENSLEITC